MPVHSRTPQLLAALLLAAGLVGACRTDTPAATEPAAPAFELETRADSVAYRAVTAYGDPATWAALPYLRFDFVVENEGTEGVPRRHLWNRQTGAYRLEWTGGEDSTYVALFDVNSREGDVYLNGAAVDTTARDALLAQAYRLFINDSYWLLAPAKLLDSGVHRTYVADSSDADRDVVLLTFQGVGLTPGDRYWVSVDRASGRMTQWSYILEGNPDAPARTYRWTGYETLETPHGPVHVATRKEAVGAPRAILTKSVAVPNEVPAALFTDPEPRL